MPTIKKKTPQWGLWGARGTAGAVFVTVASASVVVPNACTICMAQGMSRNPGVLVGLAEGPRAQNCNASKILLYLKVDETLGEHKRLYQFSL